MLVDSKDFGSAVLVYSNMQPMLQAHGHIGFLRPMSREAHEIMKVMLLSFLYLTASFLVQDFTLFHSC